MAAQLTPHEAMVAWGEACSKYLALEPEDTYNAWYDFGKHDELDASDDALDVIDDAEVRVMDAWYAARAAYQAAGQPAAVRMLEQLSTFGYGDAAEIEDAIDSVVAPPRGGWPVWLASPRRGRKTSGGALCGLLHG